MQDQFSTTWMAKLKAGESAAAHDVWMAYHARLIRLAHKKLAGNRLAAADEEDVVLAAFHSFFRGVEAGRFPRLDDEHDLWQILIMLTARKAIDQLEHERRQKRGGGKVKGESVFDVPGQSTPGIAQVVGNAPTPEFAIQMAEQLDERLAQLNDEVLRRIAVAKLDGVTNKDIASQEQVGVRTVERKLELIREIWQHELP